MLEGNMIGNIYNDRHREIAVATLNLDRVDDMVDQLSVAHSAVLAAGRIMLELGNESMRADIEAARDVVDAAETRVNAIRRDYSRKLTTAREAVDGVA
ncbi:hypothetical protein AB0C34_17455 [Nocardia sp. NPDC049220]|uniref:hypothetical protein n=1 Tax=Nocardia sp. NPDC049220 TaxID=3155273 RepID=UPI0033D5B22B